MSDSSTCRLLVAGLAAFATAASAQPAPPYLDFKGRALVALSDADMVASAYVDGDLGSKPAGLEDTLTVIPLGRGPASMAQPALLAVSNAVTAWPSNLSLTPDGRFGIVTELGAPAARGARRFDELRPGRGLALFDLSDTLRPRLVKRTDLAATTVAAAVHPAGSLVAVTLREGGEERRIAFLRIEDGQLGSPVYAPLPGATSDAPHIEWHPSGRFLAATFADRNEIRFYELVGGETARPSLMPWGEAVATGPLPGVGYFTPDGRHFVLTNLYWGGSVADTFLGTQTASLMTVRFDASAGNAAPKHAIVSSAPVGGSPENLAISPSGDLVIALNMDQSYAPPGHTRYTPYSSLTLLTLDKESGRLNAAGTYPFEGILPEGITFDASGRYLAVANFQLRNPQRGPAETTIDYWEVVRAGAGAPPSLVQLDFKTPVPRGAHIVKLIR